MTNNQSIILCYKLQEPNPELISSLRLYSRVDLNGENMNYIKYKFI